jgi:hypothetical protein
MRLHVHYVFDAYFTKLFQASLKRVQFPHWLWFASFFFSIINEIIFFTRFDSIHIVCLISTNSIQHQNQFFLKYYYISNKFLTAEATKKLWKCSILVSYNMIIGIRTLNYQNMVTICLLMYINLLFKYDKKD